VPALAWVLIGTVFFAGVHDFGAIWVSVRNKAQSIGALTGALVGPRARGLFMIVIFLLLYFNFSSIIESMIVMLSLPFAMVGGIWFIYLLGYNMSVAVGVGFIALAGVAASTGVVMLIYLDHAYEDSYNKGRMNTTADLYGAIVKGAAERVRPKMMTVLAIIGGLVPIMWGSGTGSQVMRRIAAPMVGGMVTATVLTLIVIPAIANEALFLILGGRVIIK